MVHSRSPSRRIVFNSLDRVGKDDTVAEIFMLASIEQVLIRLILESLRIQRATSLDRHWLYFEANDAQLFTICHLMSLDSHGKMIVKYDGPIFKMLSNMDTFIEIVF